LAKFSKHHFFDCARRIPETIVFFDIETTIPNFRGRKTHLLEFASSEIILEDWSVVRQFDTLISDGSDAVTSHSVAVNGITTKMLEVAPAFDSVKDSIFEALDGKLCAGHNIRAFDFHRLNDEFHRRDLPAPEPFGTLDTLTFVRRHFPHLRHSMNDLAAEFGFAEEYEANSHRALADVGFNIRIFRELLQPTNVTAYNMRFCYNFQINILGITLSRHEDYSEGIYVHMCNTVMY